MRGRMSARRAETPPPLRARSRTIRLRSVPLFAVPLCVDESSSSLRARPPERVRRGKGAVGVGVSRESGRHALVAAPWKHEARPPDGNVLLNDWCLGMQGGRNGGPGAGGGSSYEQGNVMPHMPYGADMMGAPFGAGAYQQQQQFPPNYMMPYPPQVGLAG